MEEIILAILGELRAGRPVDDAALGRIGRAQARREGAGSRVPSKRELLAYARRVEREDPARWAAWGIDAELARRLETVLRMKPRRSASGVATVTVITRPWPCSGDCVFCPSDVRMPKSYLRAEPACERAEENFFDPYLQVASRLTTLAQMGHTIDKVELIVLGGTWTDYPLEYQIWFVSEMFRALNECARVADPSLGRRRSAERREEALGAGRREVRTCKEALGSEGRDGLAKGDPACDDPARRRARYLALGFPAGEDALAAHAAPTQARVNAGELGYNAAVRRLYGASSPQGRAMGWQAAGWDGLERLQRANESAKSRVVGLVMETRPDAVDAPALASLRRLGATKVQIGVQSTCQRVLDENGRNIKVETIANAFALLRAFGFKIHAHAMVNLMGSTPEQDKADYLRLVSSPEFAPDEIKLYPCALIGSARLRERFADGSWRPYSEEELLDVLADDVLATPGYVRISRMIRDFSTGDIVAGNKKPNLRQLVERRLRERAEGGAGPAAGDAGSAAAAACAGVREMRFREVGLGEVDVSELRLDELAYECSSARERFLQWVAPDGRIAGFLRLSLPRPEYVRAHAAKLPVGPGQAMIREVHVYGEAIALGKEGRAAQHLGLGRALVERACEIAREEGYSSVNVISAVGTRPYYRGLGFADEGLYQRRVL